MLPFCKAVSEEKIFLTDGRQVMAIPHMALKNYEKRAITPRRVIRFNSKLQGM